MTSHELARKLLELPDLPIATEACGHIYAYEIGHGPVRIGLLKTYVGDHLIVGSMIQHIKNAPNWWVEEILYKEPYDFEKSSLK